ncbi:adenine phosphoribosyltransferase [Bacteroidota bacterium]
MREEELKRAIRDVPDFPKKGILFKDLTTAFKDPEILKFIAESIYETYKDARITKVVGIESRGFIAGSIVANMLGAGFVLARKPGKLPADTYKQTYQLEYGEDSIEIHKDAIAPDDVVLLHDDLLATGGTANAAVELIRKAGARNIFINFIVELTFLEGRDKLGNDTPITCLVQF